MIGFLLLVSAVHCRPGVAAAIHPPRRERYRWKNVDIVAGGFVDGITYHPSAKDLVYARTDIGGAYRWDPRSSRWIPLLDWLTKPDWNLYGIEAFALDPQDPKMLYLACGTYTNQWGNNGAILRSANQGKTFLRSDLPFKFGGNEDGRSMGERLAVDPNAGNVLYFGTRNNGLWKSGDRGATWAQVDSFPIKARTNGIGVTSVSFDGRSSKLGFESKTIYVGVASREQNLYRSGDSGKSWSPVPGAPQGFYVHHLVVTSTGALFETLSDGPGPNGIGNGAVYKFDIDSGTWKDVSPVKPKVGGEEGFGYAGLSVNPKNPQRLAVSTLDRWRPGDDVFLSDDGGSTWSGVRQSSVMDPAAAPYMTWGDPKPRFGWWTGSVAMDPFQPNRILFGTGANIWGCDDVGPAASGRSIRWTVRGTGIEETADIDLLSPSQGPHLISALGDIGGFTHWNLNHPAPGMSLNPLLDNTDSISASSDAKTIVRVGRPDHDQAPGGVSHDQGLTWKAFPSKIEANANGGSVAVSSDGKKIVWAPSRAAIAFTTDDGASWTPCFGLPARSEVVADPVDGSFYGLSKAGKLYWSRDGKDKFRDTGWSGISGPHGELRVCFGQTGQLWIPAEDGLYRSLDHGATFTKLAQVDAADSIGFGKGTSGSAIPAVFINGKVNGSFGVFRSDDGCANWILITDPQHEYGTRGIVIGDPRIYGRVYLGTNGRGVLYGDRG